MSRILLAAKTNLDGITHEQTIMCMQLYLLVMWSYLPNGKKCIKASLQKIAKVKSVNFVLGFLKKYRIKWNPYANK